jgi:hypothetical protein
MSGRTILRARFNTTAGAWQIELEGFAGLYWKTIKDGKTPRFFKTFNDVLEYLETTGLGQVYTDATLKTPWDAVREKIKVQTQTDAPPCSFYRVQSGGGQQ